MVPRPSDEGSISQLTLAARRGGRRLRTDRLMNQEYDSWVKSLLGKDLRFRDESERADSGGESETYVKSDFLKLFIFNGLGKYKSTQLFGAGVLKIVNLVTGSWSMNRA